MPKLQLDLRCTVYKFRACSGQSLELVGYSSGLDRGLIYSSIEIVSRVAAAARWCGEVFIGVALPFRGEWKDSGRLRP